MGDEPSTDESDERVRRWLGNRRGGRERVVRVGARAQGFQTGAMTMSEWCREVLALLILKMDLVLVLKMDCP